MTEHDSSTPAPAARRWQPVCAADRRILGVLVEKAKTTPDVYPMSVNALCTGANQKNNRAPIMELEPDGVEEALVRLRQLGAVAEVQGGGRVPRYRHYLYEWLGVDKLEMAVMAELLLRGPQTEGELRGRAARMEPIADLTALRPVLESLKAKELVLPLTPEGRGHVVTHALYQPRELERLRADYLHTADSRGDDAEQGTQRPQQPMHLRLGGPTMMPCATAGDGESRTSATVEHRIESSELLRKELNELRAQVDQLRAEVRDLHDLVQRTENELAELKKSLGA